MNSNDGRIEFPACSEYDLDLADLVDGALEPGRVGPVRTHLASCARCQRFVADLEAIDRRLAGALPRPALSPEFDTKLAARIGHLRRTQPRDRALADADAEYESLLGALTRGWRWRTALNAAAMASVAGGVAVAVINVAPGLTEGIGLTVSQAAATGFTLGGLALLASALLTRRASTAAEGLFEP
jgi:anti-sigma factor RsiW